MGFISMKPWKRLEHLIPQCGPVDGADFDLTKVEVSFDSFPCCSLRLYDICSPTHETSRRVSPRSFWQEPTLMSLHFSKCLP